MRDGDLRFALRTRLQAQYASDYQTRIVEEMGIWSGSVRIDVAVINGELHGYELKSARDTLVRLPSQANLYNEVFDRVTLVTAECHVEDALHQIPNWWGLLIARLTNNGPVALSNYRIPQENSSVNPVQLATLLWRTEILDILQRLGRDRGVRAGTLGLLRKRLVASVSSKELSELVRDKLKSRQNWLR